MVVAPAHFGACGHVFFFMIHLSNWNSRHVAVVASKRCYRVRTVAGSELRRCDDVVPIDWHEFWALSPFFVHHLVSDASRKHVISIHYYLSTTYSC